ncbi:serine/threonine-protein phosphatase 6 regulatory ankyrin repeat subunit C [Impatiens glandulifera]|uniref:serine/threonine-protein phosphatase 6 regulatory ankyrin repeat subunit C n=1 Tax=Impatiens glandulifera TaxID=253017 RepID=UPI001FB15DA2|nr:serine/threonine-protein phosphatase 6 regulatory ankyrin repeat subunit C [Impatiens glandulifera]
MTVFGHSGSGGGNFLTGKQVFPVDCEAEVSLRLLEASLSGDLKSAVECISDPLVDVNFVGAVCLKVRKAEVLCRDELPNEVRFQYEEFKTDVTALFVAVHVGNVTLVRKLLNSGADVNQKLFRGFSTTEAVREDHLEILEILLKSGASQPSCEEALMEASCHGRASLVGLLMGSDLIRTQVAIHALVTACCRGFTDVVDTLVKCGVDANATDRMLLQSYRPSLHTNLDCTALVAAVVSRQVEVVKQLLQVSGTIDVKARIGAWSWDTTSGEEIRVGAGMAEPYPITWCAVEYFEQSGTILRTLLEYSSPNTLHHGRTLLHHAILCGSVGSVSVLLNSGANVEAPVKTCENIEFRAIHMAARLGLASILQRVIDSGCDLNSRTDTGETALMISVRYKRDECLKVLVAAGADLGLVNLVGRSASSIAESNGWALSFRDSVINSIRSGKSPKTTNASVFSPILFVAKSGDVEALKCLMGRTEIDIDYQDEKGFSAVMISVMEGHVDAFRLLVYAGADVKLPNKFGETAITLSSLNQNRYQFEKVLLDFELEKGNRSNGGGFFALHCAARRGDLPAVRSLTDRGYDLNMTDGDGYTPLMIAAREGNEGMCRLLISLGAKCDAKNGKGETALSLAIKSGSSRNTGVVNIIEDEIARRVVIKGSIVMKHTKGGRGVLHGKAVRMVEESGVLRWGDSRRRNVICKEVEIGASIRFGSRRQRKGGDDGKDPGVFRVVTMKNKEVHFACEGGIEMAKMWVRGIKLVTSEARVIRPGFK